MKSIPAFLLASNKRSLKPTMERSQDGTQILECDADEGFTLIEVLTTLVIVSILSAIAIPSFLNQANKARESEAAANIGIINRAQQVHYIQKVSFASGLDELDLGITESSSNYTYTIAVAGSELDAAAIATASPNGQLKGHAGRVWLVPVENGLVTQSVACSGTAGALPDGWTVNSSESTSCP